MEVEDRAHFEAEDQAGIGHSRRSGGCASASIDMLMGCLPSLTTLPTCMPNGIVGAPPFSQFNEKL